MLMITTNEIGSNWADVTIKDIFREPIMLPNFIEGPYHGGDYGPVTYRMLCACGHEWEVEKAKFPGRRRMKNCGRAECEYSQPKEEKPKRERAGRPGSSDPSSIAAWYITLKVQVAVSEYAQAHDISVGKAADSLLRNILQLD